MYACMQVEVQDVHLVPFHPARTPLTFECGGFAYVCVSSDPRACAAGEARAQLGTRLPPALPGYVCVHQSTHTPPDDVLRFPLKTALFFWGGRGGRVGSCRRCDALRCATMPKTQWSSDRPSARPPASPASRQVTTRQHPCPCLS